MADKTVKELFADMAKQINLPKIDYEAFVDIHRKNIEGDGESAAVVSEGGRAFSRSNRKSWRRLGAEARQLIVTSSPGVLLRKLRPSRRSWPSVCSKRQSRNTRDVAELVQHRTAKRQDHS